MNHCLHVAWDFMIIPNPTQLHHQKVCVYFSLEHVWIKDHSTVYYKGYIDLTMLWTIVYMWIFQPSWTCKVCTSTKPIIILEPWLEQQYVPHILKNWRKGIHLESQHYPVIQCLVWVRNVENDTDYNSLCGDFLYLINALDFFIKLGPLNCIVIKRSSNKWWPCIRFESIQETPHLAMEAELFINIWCV